VQDISDIGLDSATCDCHTWSTQPQKCCGATPNGLGAGVTIRLTEAAAASATAVKESKEGELAPWVCSSDRKLQFQGQTAIKAGGHLSQLRSSVWRHVVVDEIEDAKLLQAGKSRCNRTTTSIAKRVEAADAEGLQYSSSTNLQPKSCLLTSSEFAVQALFGAVQRAAGCKERGAAEVAD
jgi:hypothetical protein